MNKFIFALGLLLFPAFAQAQQCHVTASGAPSCATQTVATQTVVAAAPVQTYSIPVQVVSPQVVAAAPQAVVTQNTYTQQVVGAAIVSQGYVQPTVTAQAPVVVVQPQQVQVQTPAVVHQYNAGVGAFQGTQNYVRTQVVGVNANVNHNVVVQHNVATANANVVVQHNHAVNAVNANNGGLGAKIFGNKTVTKTKTVTKSR